MWAGLSNFLKSHERLLLFIGLLCCMVWGFSKYFDHAVTVDKTKAEEANQTLQAQITQNKQTAEQMKQTLAQNQQLTAQLAAQNSQLLSAIAVRNQKTVVQQTVDKTLAPPELAVRLQSLSGGSVSPNAAGYQLDQVAATQATIKLEEVPTLQANVADLQTQVANKDREISSNNDVISSQTAHLTGLSSQIVDQQKSCSAEITLVKAQARKSKLRWFGAGYAAGWVSAVALKIFG